MITSSDVLSVSWSDPYFTYNTSNLEPATLPLPISVTNAGFTNPSGKLYFSLPSISVEVDANTNYSNLGGEEWVYPTGFIERGFGHWIITNAASVPEPSTVTLVLFALACGLGCALASRREQQRTDVPLKVKCRRV